MFLCPQLSAGHWVTRVSDAGVLCGAQGVCYAVAMNDISAIGIGAKEQWILFHTTGIRIEEQWTKNIWDSVLHVVGFLMYGLFRPTDYWCFTIHVLGNVLIRCPTDHGVAPVLDMFWAICVLHSHP